MKYLLFPAVALLFSLSSLAQEVASAAKNDIFDELIISNMDTIRNRKGEILQEVIINGRKAQKEVSVTRSGIKPMDLPQSIQVIGNEIITQQQTIRLSEIVKNANGVYVSSARGGAQESFYSRGYDMTTNNMFKNGFRLSSGTIPEVASLEKVEILKGSSALLYGNVAPGGILNMVTKKPNFNQGGAFSMQLGSYSYYKPSFDYYGPLNNSIAYRFTGTYENSESFRDQVKNKRHYFNPSFLFKAGQKTEIILQGDYLNYDWTPDFGTGIIGKEYAKLPRNTYLGATWANGKTTQANISTLIDHDLNENWKLNFNTSFLNTDRASIGIERIQPTTNGDWNRPLGRTKNQEQIIAEQLSIQGNFYTGNIKHQLFSGVDFDNTFTNANTYAFLGGITYDTVNIFDFHPSRTDIPESFVTKTTKTETNSFGIYSQDLISFTKQLKVLAGIRWSWQEQQANIEDFTKTSATHTEGAKIPARAFSPKLGLVYQPDQYTSFFVSYANSFTPNSGTNVNFNPIKPSVIDQYEAGIKKDFWRGILSSNITVYQIANNNLAQMAEFLADGVTPNSDSTIKTLNGATKSKGVEVDITAKPTEGLSIMAGYSYNDMRYTKTSGLLLSPIEGHRLTRTPYNTANLSVFYKSVTGKFKGISIGALAYYIGDRVGGWDNRYIADPNNAGNLIIQDREIPLKGYTTIDFSAGYEWKQFSLMCKLSNISNELNYTVHENYSANPIAPRQLMAILMYKF